MDGRRTQIHVLSSRVGDLIEGKTEERKTKLVASLALRSGAIVGFRLKSYGKYWVRWRRVTGAWRRWLSFHEFIAYSAIKDIYYQSITAAKSGTEVALLRFGG